MSVKSGVVILSGFVRSYMERYQAEADPKRVAEEALRRAAELDANHITVETNGNEVILRGTVQSWSERQEAERAAWQAPGVANVDNRIIVSP